MKNLNIDVKYSISLGIILVLAIVPTFAHHGHILFDCSREAYYPTQILLGKILYKDIFNIYGPFSYIYNAFLFKIFGINLNVLYLSGCICAFSITGLIYLIARRFLSSFVSFSIALFTISIGVLNLNLFNFIFPYSYAMLYGLVAFLASFLFLLKYQEKPEKTLLLYISCFFAGLCVTSKYEFLPYIFVILYVIFKTKPLKLKEYYYTILSLIFVPFFCFGILFLQGLDLNDLILSISTVKKMTQSQTLNYFYQHMGVFFNRQTIPIIFEQFLNIIIPILILLLANGRKKIISIPLIILTAYIIIKKASFISFYFLPVFITFWLLGAFKSIKQNEPLLILTLSALFISLKIFWGLLIWNYGSFFISFLLITIIALISNKFKNNHKISKSLGILIILYSLIFGFPIFQRLQEKNYKIQTARGKIYGEKDITPATKELIEYIENNTKQTDTIIILPEGSLINFLTNRKSDNYYTSLIPIYWEVFGDRELIKHFQKTKPEYIIFNNSNTSSDYYLGPICNNYALGLCSFVAKNYKQVKIIDKNLKYIVFKK